MTTGKTPMLDGSEWRQLLNAIPADTVKLHILSLASAFTIATATAGFAATNTDSTGGPNASTTSPSATTTVVPGSASPVMTGQNGPYASPGRVPHAATVGPTGSLTRDAANPNGAQRPGGGDNSDGSKL